MNVRNNGIYMGLIVSGVMQLSCGFDNSSYNARFQPFTDNFYNATGYQLLEPSQTYFLPDILNEISGLSTLNDSVLACVQDESGVIFMYGLNEKGIIDRHRFAGAGDFEGIQIIGEQAFVLKSNGEIYRYNLRTDKTKVFETPLKRKNNAEGLGFDPDNNRLLIACKGRPGLGSNDLNGRAVYSYHLTQGFDPEILYLITPEDLESWNQAQPEPLNLTQRQKNFMPSGIAVHPFTSEVYLLANVGKLLIVLTPEGEIKYCVPLSPRIFRQPEGICFTSKGDLIISNEGQDGSGKILVFAKD